MLQAENDENRKMLKRAASRIGKAMANKRWTPMDDERLLEGKEKIVDDIAANMSCSTLEVEKQLLGMIIFRRGKCAQAPNYQITNQLGTRLNELATELGRTYCSIKGRLCSKLTHQQNKQPHRTVAERLARECEIEDAEEEATNDSKSENSGNREEEEEEQEAEDTEDKQEASAKKKRNNSNNAVENEKVTASIAGASSDHTRNHSIDGAPDAASTSPQKRKHETLSAPFTLVAASNKDHKRQKKTQEENENDNENDNDSNCKPAIQKSRDDEDTDADTDSKGKKKPTTTIPRIT